MRWALLSVLLVGLQAVAQSGYDSITLSRYQGLRFYGSNFKEDGDSIYRMHIRGEKRYVEKATNAKRLIKLLQQIKANGTGDISKCFIPRHAVNFYKEGQIVEAVVVCFECDGIRFSGSGSTPVKNEALRIKQISSLNQLFSESGFFQQTDFYDLHLSVPVN